jgi:hypothetical protein
MIITVFESQEAFRVVDLRYRSRKPVYMTQTFCGFIQSLKSRAAIALK